MHVIYNCLVVLKSHNSGGGPSMYYLSVQVILKFIRTSVRLSNLWLSRGCAMGQNGLMVSALDIIHPEGKGKGITMHCIHYLRQLCIKQRSNSPGMKKSQLDLSTPAQIAGKHVNVTKNTKKTEKSCFHDYNITKKTHTSQCKHST